LFQRAVGRGEVGVHGSLSCDKVSLSHLFR
jgi:hypothetical protein